MPVTRVHETVIKSNDITSIKTELEQAKQGQPTLLARINQFSSSMDAVAINSKILAAKTNLKLDHYKQAIRESLNEMIIDCFEDTSGIDASKSSNYVRDVVNATDDVVKSSNGSLAVVTSVADTLTAKPSVVYITVQETLQSGSINYFMSLDDGATWFALSKDAATFVPTNQSISNPVKCRVKAEITGNAYLQGWAYGWK